MQIKTNSSNFKNNIIQNSSIENTSQLNIQTEAIDNDENTLDISNYKLLEKNAVSEAKNYIGYGTLNEKDQVALNSLIEKVLNGESLSIKELNQLFSLFNKEREFFDRKKEESSEGNGEVNVNSEVSGNQPNKISELNIQIHNTTIT